MLSFKYSGLFNVLEMPLQTSTSMWLNSKILSLVHWSFDHRIQLTNKKSEVRDMTMAEEFPNEM